MRTEALTTRTDDTGVLEAAADTLPSHRQGASPHDRLSPHRAVSIDSRCIANWDRLHGVDAVPLRSRRRDPNRKSSRPPTRNGCRRWEDGYVELVRLRLCTRLPYSQSLTLLIHATHVLVGFEVLLCRSNEFTFLTLAFTFLCCRGQTDAGLVQSRDVEFVRMFPCGLRRPLCGGWSRRGGRGRGAWRDI